jgi:hypothetical protein
MTTEGEEAHRVARKMQERRGRLTMSATLEVVSNRVGKSGLLMNELTEAMFLVDFERWRHMRILSGSPGPWGWKEMTKGED